jgi:2-polyprenyl-3-methyl-5-hydroxy-6-metoxy-1,4-benzoquinol methylase
VDGSIGDGYNIVVCLRCGAGFADGVPSQREMDKYYEEHSKYSYNFSGGVESIWALKRFEATVQQVLPFLKSHKIGILDIGCATGGLLSVFKKHGFSNLTGVDPSSACVESVARLHGINARAATLTKLKNWKERFDLILMLGVLEHLREVRKAIGIASRLLNDGGRLYCAVPNVEGLAICSNAPYQQFSGEHVNFFSPVSLRRLMAECNMTEICAWSWTVEWREGTFEPIASGLYECRSRSPRQLFDEITEPSLRRYLRFSKKGDREIGATIDCLRKNQMRVLVWGAGTLARRLLATSRFSEINIVAFVDSNSDIQGKTLAGRPILSPAQIVVSSETILICSIAFEKEIVETIRLRHGLRNKIVSILGRDLS